jgi:hypothetical protein
MTGCEILKPRLEGWAPLKPGILIVELIGYVKRYFRQGPVKVGWMMVPKRTFGKFGTAPLFPAGK